MRRGDIRFNGQAAVVEHASARGRITRNSGNFTRGSQLLSSQYKMAWAASLVPVWIWLGSFIVLFNVMVWLGLAEHEFQLDLMKLYSTVWTWVGGDRFHLINLTLPNGTVTKVPIGYVPYEPHVVHAWHQTVKIFLSTLVMATAVAAPLISWFITWANKRGRDVLTERHNRGSMLVAFDLLLHNVRRHNLAQFQKECAKHDPPYDPRLVAKAPIIERVDDGIHVPYSIAGIPYPWRLEQSHTMLIGTTGTGKTTQLRSHVSQIRARGHRAVIFDLTGTFVETFFDPKTDVILNPMDERCAPWTLFDECRNYADFVSAAAALIPSHPDDKEPFWQNAARMLFIEMCLKLQEAGEGNNAAIAHHLMTADLKKIHSQLEDTVAGPLTTEKAARMAESIRSVLNVNGQALRFMPDPVEGGAPAFSIRDWIATDNRDGSIMFITGSYNDLEMTRGLFTLWIDLAVNNLMRLPKTRDLRTWYLFDEVHALHALPGIEHGLQSARNFGGAFVLGIHSFDKLVATYGLQNATALTGLARTKLILATADRTTAEKCSEFIGNREVRQVDEAYSYGYNNTRDASTLTPRTAVEPLVLPDDITDLPSLNGFVKFPDGFPAARIKLTYKSYPEVAPGSMPRKDFKPTPYVSPEERRKKAAQNKGADEGGEGGREHTPTRPVGGVEERGENEPEQTATEPRKGQSEAEKAAAAMDVVGATQVALDQLPGHAAGTSPQATASAPLSDDKETPLSKVQAARAGLRLTDPGMTRNLDQGQQAARGDAVRSTGNPILDRLDGDRQEDQSVRELRDGFATNSNAEHHHRHQGHDHSPAIDDDMDMGM